MNKPTLLRVLTIAGALFAASVAGAANRVVNGDFKTDVSGWTVEEPDNAVVSFSPIDGSGAVASGSIRIINIHPGPGQGTGASQCMGPVTAGSTYTYRAKVLFPAGQARSGSARIGLRWYAGPGCTGGTLTQPRAGPSGPGDAWVSVNGGAEKAPVGAVSAGFVVFPSKEQAGGELLAQFDDIVFDDGLPDPVPNYQGSWWRAPAGFEAGWGINFSHQGDTIFATWFTYDLAGKPLWLAVLAEKVAPGVYTGALFTTTGPPFNAEPFDPTAVVETTIGTATFTFTSENSATFDYTVNIAAPLKLTVTQSKQITRQLFAQPVPRCVWNGLADIALATNAQDLWWRFPAGFESGWGINIAHQDETFFVTWFTYGADGKPLWIAGVLTRTAPGVYSGDLFTTTGPAFNAVPFEPSAVIETIVGTGKLTFTDGNAGNFEYTVNGISQTKPITRQVFAGTGTACQ